MRYNDVSIFLLGAGVGFAPCSWLCLVFLFGRLLSIFLQDPSGAGGLVVLALPAVIVCDPGRFLLHIANDERTLYFWIGVFYALTGGLFALGWSRYQLKNYKGAARFLLLSILVIAVAFCGTAIRARSLLQPYRASVAASASTFKCSDQLGISLGSLDSTKKEDTSEPGVFFVFPGGKMDYIGRLKNNQVEVVLFSHSYNNDHLVQIILPQLKEAISSGTCKNIQGVPFAAVGGQIHVDDRRRP
jgi:hypothetical protein